MKIGMRFALAIVSFILLVSLSANGYLYNSLSENSNFKKQNEEMQSQISSLESQTDNLQNQISELKNQSSTDNNTIASLNNQITNLQLENNNLQKENMNLVALVRSLQNKTSTQNQSSGAGGPYLVTRLGTKIYKIVPIGGSTQQRVLVIGGDVENDGNGTAYNCQIKVVTSFLTPPYNTFTDYFQLGTGTLTVGEKVDFFANVIHGNVSDIGNWQIFPECTNTP